MNRARPLPATLPLDIKRMNICSALFALMFAAMLLTVGVAWLIRQPFFNLSAISVQGDVVHNNAITFRTNVAPQLAGNFFTVNLNRTREAFETVPWVRRAVVQREFPNRLRVILQEHQAIAYWGQEGDNRLVNNFGEVFEANQGDTDAEDLPVLVGPQGQAMLLVQAYRMLAPIFQDGDAVLEQLQLSNYGSWRGRLGSGAVIELGHGPLEQIEAQTRRFISTVTQVSSRYGRDLESADLRYGAGYAIKLRGVTTTNAGGKDDGKNKR